MTRPRISSRTIVWMTVLLEASWTMKPTPVTTIRTRERAMWRESENAISPLPKRMAAAEITRPSPITLARDGRSEQARAVDHRRVERDRIGQVGAVFDHLHDEGLAGRRVERVDDALEGAQDEDPHDVDGPGQGEAGQRERLQHREGLGD